MDIRKAFGRSIKRFRNKKGVSQEQFALSIGMDRTYYASVENGRRNISILNIYKISDGLGVPLTELFSVIESNLKDEEDTDDV